MLACAMFSQSKEVLMIWRIKDRHGVIEREKWKIDALVAVAKHFKSQGMSYEEVAKQLNFSPRDIRLWLDSDSVNWWDRLVIYVCGSTSLS